MQKILDGKQIKQQEQGRCCHRLKETQETYQPDAMCKPCLEADRNNPVVKKDCGGNGGELITDQLLRNYQWGFWYDNGIVRIFNSPTF